MTVTSRINWKAELDNIRAAGLEGKTQQDLATHYGVTRQRMKQIIDRYFPEWHSTMGAIVKRNEKARKHFAKWGAKVDTDVYLSQRIKFRAKKAAAKRLGWEWSLNFGDLEWPTHCPILGMELDWFAETRQENSPSFDRIDSSKGYVTGNVQILSWRANRIKNDGTAHEHKLIAEYLDKIVQHTSCK